MRTSFIFVLSLFSVAVFSGCFEVETIITVKRDGSGTVREHVVLKNEMIIMMLKLTQQMRGDERKQEDGEELFDQKTLREKAGSMGEGVTFISGEALTEDGEGYEATYAFKDINTLRVKTIPDFQQPNSSGDRDEEEDRKEITFEFRKGSPATLIVFTPPVERNKREFSDEEQEDEGESIETARTLLKDFRISTVIEIDGTVVESDATFREKSRIILTDIDFDKLTADENLLRAAMKNDNPSDDAVKELMKKYPGLKVELNKKTTVRFR